MPRISEPTVAEHRAAQRRRLLDAAHDHLAEHRTPPTLAQVAARAGVSRPAVYQYFASREALLAAVVQDVIPRWNARIADAIEHADGPAEQVVAYAHANLQLVAEGSHAVASALAGVAPPDEVTEQASEIHAQVFQPLTDALVELGVSRPNQVASIVNSMIHAAMDLLEDGHPLDEVIEDLDLILRPMVGSMG